MGRFRLAQVKTRHVRLRRAGKHARPTVSLANGGTDIPVCQWHGFQPVRLLTYTHRINPVPPKTLYWWQSPQRLTASAKQIRKTTASALYYTHREESYFVFSA